MSAKTIKDEIIILEGIWVFIMKLSFLRSESSNRAIAFSMVMSLAAKILTLVQSQVISYSFGTTRSTDILFSTLNIILMFTANTIIMNVKYM
jgi:hypothetical protein